MNSSHDGFQILNLEQERIQTGAALSLARNDLAEFLDVRSRDERAAGAYQHSHLDGIVVADLCDGLTNPLGDNRA